LSSLIAENTSQNVSKFQFKDIGKTIFRFSLKKIVISFSASIVGIFSLRLLGPTELGKLNFVNQIFSIFSILLLFSLDNALERFIPTYHNKKTSNTLFSTIFCLALLIIFIFVCIFFVITQALNVLPLEIQGVYYTFIILISINILLQINIGMLKGLGRFDLLPNLDFINELLGKLFSVLLLIFVSTTYKVPFYSSILFLFIILIFSSFVLRKNFSLPNVKILKTKGLLHFSMMAYFAVLASIIYSSLDILFLKYYLNPTAVGYYGAGTRIPILIFSMLFLPLQSPFLHFLTNPKYDQFKANEYRVIKYLLVFSGLISLCIYSLSHVFIIVLAGNKFLPSVSILQITSLGLFFQCITIYFNALVVSKNKPIYLTIIIIFGLFVNFFGDLILIPLFNYNGAAFSYLLTKFAIFAGMLLFSYKFFHFIIDKNFILINCVFIISILVSIFTSTYLSPIIFILLIFILKIFKYNELKSTLLSIMRN
jgi:O-antigen/teichoic acid export membrane protein